MSVRIHVRIVGETRGKLLIADFRYRNKNGYQKHEDKTFEPRINQVTHDFYCQLFQSIFSTDRWMAVELEKFRRFAKRRRTMRQEDHLILFFFHYRRML